MAPQIPTPMVPESAPAQVDLRRYDQSDYDPGRSKPIILLWWLVQAIAFPLTLHAHHAPRRFLLRLFGARLGQGVVIRPTARFHYPWQVAIDDYSWVGSDVVFYSLAPIHIGTHCVISQGSYLCAASHDPHDPAFGLQPAPIVVENGAWVATDCFIGPGVRIGANAVIGARSSVFKDMPPQQFCWGSPCRPHRPRTFREDTHGIHTHGTGAHGTGEFPPESR